MLPLETQSEQVLRGGGFPFFLSSRKPSVVRTGQHGPALGSLWPVGVHPRGQGA